MRVLASVIAASAIAASGAEAAKGACYLKTFAAKDVSGTVTAVTDIKDAEMIVTEYYKKSTCLATDKVGAAPHTTMVGTTAHTKLAGATAGFSYAVHLTKTATDGVDGATADQWLKKYLTAGGTNGGQVDGKGCGKGADFGVAAADDLGKAGILGVKFEAGTGGKFTKKYYKEATCTTLVDTAVEPHCTAVPAFAEGCEGTAASVEWSATCLGYEAPVSGAAAEVAAAKTTREKVLLDKIKAGLPAPTTAYTYATAKTACALDVDSATDFSADQKGTACGKTCGCLLEEYNTECRLKSAYAKSIAHVEAALHFTYRNTNKEGQCKGKFKKDDKATDAATNVLANTKGASDAFTCTAVAADNSGAISTRSAVAAVVVGAFALLF